MKTCCDPVNALKAQMVSLESKLNTKVLEFNDKLRNIEGQTLVIYCLDFCFGESTAGMFLE